MLIVGGNDMLVRPRVRFQMPASAALRSPPSLPHPCCLIVDIAARNLWPSVLASELLNVVRNKNARCALMGNTSCSHASI